MGIEATFMVKRSDAVSMLESKGCTVYKNDSLERLADLLYENRSDSNDTENYEVVEDDYVFEKWDMIKHFW